MTCVVGLVHEGNVWIGADAAAVDDGYYAFPAKQPKVFRNGSYLFGFTTSFRMGQILQYRFVPPEPPAGCELHEFMVTTFVDAWREALREGDAMKSEEGREVGGRFLAGVRGQLFEVDDDFNVLSTTFDFGACGSGVSPALGALYATRGDPRPMHRLAVALEAASLFVTTVQGPYTILGLPAEAPLPPDES